MNMMEMKYEFKDVIKTPEKTYELLERKGSGAQGTVWKARIVETDQIIALKIITPEGGFTEQQIEFIRKEIDALKRLSSDGCNMNVVCYYGYYIQQNRVLIEMQYIEGKNLLEWAIQFLPTELFYGHLIALLKDLSSALLYIHGKGVIHRDIKPENILVDENDIPIIVDFGLSCLSFISRQGVSECQGSPGTPTYTPPETFNNQVSYNVSDVWSLGVTIFQLAEKRYPFNFGNMNDLQKIYQTVNQTSPERLNTTNRKLNDIVNGSIVKDPARRLTVPQMRQILYN